MKRSAWFYLFWLVFLTDLIAVAIEQPTIRYGTKPLLMVTLFLTLMAETKGIKNTLRRWITGALFFSWLGDIFLMFESSNGNFFILGLSSFLIAHIAYITLFFNIARREKIAENRWLLVPVLAYYEVMMRILTPHLGDMVWPVRIYGAVISAMLLQCLPLFKGKNRSLAYQFVGGALLFVLSDSLLAINKFYSSFYQAGLAVMFTYGMAQFLLVNATIGYINHKTHERDAEN